MAKAKYIFILLSLFVLDQLIKSLVPENLITANFKLPPLPIVAVLFLLFLIFYFRFFRNVNFGFILISAGALSNLADRVRFGYVRDFIDIGIAIMNPADIFIWTGIVLLFYSHVKKSL